MKLANSVEWYLRSIIIHPVYEILFVFLAFIEYGVLIVDKSPDSFIFISIIFTLPLLQTYMGTGILRNTEVRVFEITLLEGYSNVMLSKPLSLLIAYIPFIVFEAFLLGHFHIIWLFVPFIFSTILATLVSMLLSTSSNASFSSVALAIFLFIFPISFQAFLESTQQFGIHPSWVLSSLTYLLSPFVAYEFWESGVILLSPTKGLLISLAGFLILLGVYILLSLKQQIKP